MTNSSHELVAYPVGFTEGWDIVPASHRRSWMDATPGEFAYRCLPMTVANQAGWIVKCPISFTARWVKCEDSTDEIFFESDSASEQHKNQIKNHFGSGIITFTIPYLFRTPEGVSLLARGLPNEHKAHRTPLEGIVETDWNTSTFTMNWRIVTPNIDVCFAAGEPICFLQPLNCSLIESLTPVVRSLESAPELARKFNEWADSRKTFNESPTRGNQWQKHYHKGVDLEGQRPASHRTKLQLKALACEPSAIGGPSFIQALQDKDG